MCKNWFKPKFRFVKKSESDYTEEYTWWHHSEVKKHFLSDWVYVEGSGSFDYQTALAHFKRVCAHAKKPEKIVLLNSCETLDI